MDAISGSNISYSYECSGYAKAAIHQISLSIKKGEFVALLGRNGCGKSTLAKHFNALVPLQTGEISVFGINTKDENNIWELRKICGMVFQNPDNQFVSSVVEEDIAFGLQNYDTPAKYIPDKVKKALELVSMSGFEKRAPHNLSGGQKQRIAIAGVLAMNPEIIVFDEATSMLDPQGREEILEIMHKLHKIGKTILMISHYIEETILADRILLIDKGRLIADGTPRQILTNPQLLLQAGILPTTAVSLYFDLLKNGIKLKNCPLTNDELVKEICSLKLINNKKFINKPKLLVKQTKQNKPIKPIKTIIRLEEISFTYQSQTPFATKALDKINLCIDSGEFVGIMGQTGSGKTTLIELIAGLIAPTNGKIYLDGDDINYKNYNREKLRENVGIVFQHPECQLFETTVEKDVAFGLKSSRISSSEIADRTKWALETMGFDYENIKHQSPLALSGGEKRRVAIAGVLVSRPKILILDEPIAGLDPLARMDFLELLAKLNNEGVTILMISHNINCLCEYAKRIIVLKNGNICRDGSLEDVFAGSIYGSDAKFIADKLRQSGLPISPNIVKYDDLRVQSEQLLSSILPKISDAEL